jgi:chromosome segregation ATPase
MADTSRRDELLQTANEERTSMRLKIIRLQATIDAYQRLVNSLPEETRTQHFSTPTFRAYVADRETTLADQACAAKLLEQERESNAFLREQNRELEKNVEEYEEQLMMACHSVQLLTDTLTEQDRRLADIEASRLADPPADGNMAEELSRLRYDLSNEKATNTRFATNLRREQDDHRATAAALKEEKTVSTRLATDLRNLHIRKSRFFLRGNQAPSAALKRVCVYGRLVAAEGICSAALSRSSTALSGALEKSLHKGRPVAQAVSCDAPEQRRRSARLTRGSVIQRSTRAF